MGLALCNICKGNNKVRGKKLDRWPSFLSKQMDKEVLCFLASYSKVQFSYYFSFLLIGRGWSMLFLQQCAFPCQRSHPHNLYFLWQLSEGKMMERRKKIALELSELVIYCRPVPFDEESKFRFLWVHAMDHRVARLPVTCCEFSILMFQVTDDGA